jgi:membrane protein CcdC involved in cytochrome C biogenesis
MVRTKKKYLKFAFVGVIIVTLLLVNSGEVAAQCQACKSTVESNLADGGTSGLGLNHGILYLLAMPYIMIVSIGAIWFFRYRNKKQQLQNA